MIPLADCALRACRQYQEGAAEIEKLTKRIGEALGPCMELEGHPGLQRLMPDLKQKTHLRIAYRLAQGAGYDLRMLSPDEVDRLLSGELAAGDFIDIQDQISHVIKEINFKCADCLRAHRLIQERKRARQRFGAAKRFVRRIGKRVLEEGRGL